MGIVVEIINRTGHVQHCQIFDKNSITVGRAYTNDVVIADTYVDPVHASISCSGDGNRETDFTCQDHSSVNGIFDIKGRKQKIQSHWHSGQVISLGKTLLRITSPSIPVPPATRLSAWEKASDILTQTRVIIFVSSLCLLLATIDVYLSSFAVADKASEYTAVLYLWLALVFYAGIFAFLGKAFRQDSRFWLYYTLICGSTILVMSYDLLSGLIFFNLNLGVSSWFNIIAYILIIALLLNFSIRFALSVKTITRIAIVSIIPSLVLINLAIQMKNDSEFNWRPQYDVTAYTQTLYLAKPKTKADVLTSSQTLYKKR